MITGKDSKYNEIVDLKGTKMGISRLGRSENGPLNRTKDGLLNLFVQRESDNGFRHGSATRLENR